MNVTVVIPALNEAESLPRLVKAIPLNEGCNLQVVIIDNGSTDDTAGVARQLRATVVTEPRRCYGWACHAGVQAAAEPMQLSSSMVTIVSTPSGC